MNPASTEDIVKRISALNELVAAIGPHLSSPNPLDSLKRAGIELDPHLADALARAKPLKKFDPTFLKRLEETYGPAPVTRIRIRGGDTSIVVGTIAPPNVPAPRPTGYGGTASFDMRVINDILSELWTVQTIPRELDEVDTAHAISLGELRDTCVGVPDDATSAIARFTAPPRVSASTATPLNAHVDVPFELSVVGTTSASLVGVFRVELPLAFSVITDGTIRLELGAINGLQGVLEVAAWSVIQPRSEANRVVLQDKLADRARKALITAVYDKGLLTFAVSIPVAKKFPNSTIDVVQLGAVTARQSTNDYLIVGINVESSHEVDTAALASQVTPVAPTTLHAQVDQQFASDALSAVISSGDLADFINRVAHRHTDPLNVVPVTVNGGRVLFEHGRLQVSLDCTAVDACAFGKDLGFAATVSGVPSIENGTLAIAASEVDIDLDNVDAVWCTILSALYGPFGLLITVGVLAFLAAFNPAAKDVDIPVAETTEPLPGSDKVVDVALTRAAMSPDLLTADGYIRLVADTLHTFVHLRVVERDLQHITSPVAGATVDLFELDAPPPSGDDVEIPAVGETEQISGKFDITTVTSYTPRADEMLGTATTDATGYVRFVAVCNAVGGIATEYRTTENLLTGDVRSVQKSRLVPEAKPDLGVTIRTATGATVATRRLVGLNVPGKRLGTHDNPIVVSVKVPHVVAA